MKKKLKFKFGLVGMACALALAGCGGSDEAVPTTLTPITTTTPVATGGTADLTYATYSATPYSGGTQTAFTLKSMTVEDAGFVAPNPKANRVTLLGSGGGFEREIKIYVRDSDCVIFNIAHAWASTATDLLGPTAISTYVTDPVIGPMLGLEPANNTITFNDTLLDGNAPVVSSLKGTVKPSTKICASAVAP